MDFSQSLNESYRDEIVIKEVGKSYASEKPCRVLLQGFFSEEVYAKIIGLLKKAKREKVRIADRFSYTLITAPSEVASLFSSADFKRFLSNTIGKTVRKVDFEVREYGWRDYTLLHDAETIGGRTEFFFFILPNLAEWDYFWGGNRIYQTESGEGKPLVFTPADNSLGIVNKSADVLGFTQYINHYVGDEKMIVVEGTFS